eukprot:TRINITY_DN1991_c0_g1_i1.p1 TRINITY_DN1991_c0_g1~~TRINITY_DN1991_c0_g1_i1.p1  ORF type:complete len:927 (+),score=193.25 TRINITY_DN1991_c0_g1_i1:259-3039(+)
MRLLLLFAFGVGSILMLQSSKTSAEASTAPASIALLARLRTALLPANPSCLGSWAAGSSTDPCDASWQGVTCREGTYDVIKLDFGHPVQQLTGPIPGLEFAAFTNLTALVLSGNSFTGPLPLELMSLPNLQHLDITGNQLSGQIPASVGSMKSLNHLLLAENNFNGTIPSSIGNLTSLVRLDLNGNKLHGTIPATLSTLSKLKQLSLKLNSLSGPLGPWLGQLTQLTILELNANQLSGALPDAIGNLSLLWLLAVDENALNGTIPDSLGTNLGTLKVLYLNSNLFEGGIPSSFRDLTSLLYLDLGNNPNLSGPIPDVFGGMTKLASLSLEYCSFNGVLPTNLWNLSQLTELWVNNNELQGPLPQGLAALGSLKKLHLQNNRFTGPLPLSLCYMTQLRELNVYWNQLSGQIPQCLFELPNLVALDLESNLFTGATPALPAGSAVVLSVDNNCLSGAPKQRTTGCPVALPPPPPQGLSGSSQRWWQAVLVVGVLLASAALLGLALLATRLEAYFDKSFWAGLRPASPANLKLGVKEFSLSRIRKATANFSSVIGEGKLGTVYLAAHLLKGTGPGDGRAVVKRAKDPSKHGEFLFKCRVELLARARHRCMVNLVGACLAKQDHLLVFEYCDRGTLHERLHGGGADQEVLPWVARVRVAVNVAAALDHLHHGTSPPIIHRDVTAASIYFCGEDDHPKLAEFGVSSRDAGSGPLPPKRSAASARHPRRARKGGAGPTEGEAVTEKTDVYAFGVLLLELISGQPPMKDVHITSLAAPFLEDPQMTILMVDSRLGGHCVPGELALLAGIARDCIREQPERRPTMREIVRRLEQGLRFDSLFFPGVDDGFSLSNSSSGVGPGSSGSAHFEETRRNPGASVWLQQPSLSFFTAPFQGWFRQKGEAAEPSHIMLSDSGSYDNTNLEMSHLLNSRSS